MCGLFGFTGQQPDNDKLKEIATLASQRGPHAFGFATASGRWIRKVGPAKPHLPLLENLRTHTVIGHARLATSGDYKEAANNQPQRAGRTFVAHNGNVPEWRKKAADNFLTLATDCDSELIAAQLEATADRRPADAIRLLDLEPFALLAITIQGLLVGRRHLPLWMEETAAGLYFCSVQFGSAAEWMDETAAIIKWPGQHAVIPVAKGTRPRKEAGWRPAEQRPDRY